MHEELGGVDEDLVSAVADGAVPPGALWGTGRKEKHPSPESIPNRTCVCGTAGKVRTTYHNDRKDDHEG